MISSSINDSHAQNALKKKFGYLINGILYMNSENEVKKISTYFKPLVEHKI